MIVNISDRHLAHARHLRNCAKLFDSEVEYGDWLVVTYFYSCLHYVSSWVFREPVIVQANGSQFECSDLSTYHNTTKAHLRDESSRHTKLHALLRRRDSALAADYKWLLDLSMEFRYKRFILTEEEARAAVQCADGLIDALEKELTG